MNTHHLLVRDNKIPRISQRFSESIISHYNCNLEFANWPHVAKIHLNQYTNKTFLETRRKFKCEMIYSYKGVGGNTRRIVVPPGKYCLFVSLVL